jgi:putative alpha-1,2-mannosidase
VTEVSEDGEVLPTRRGFLKASGLAAIGTAFAAEKPARAIDASATSENNPTGVPTNPVDLVNLLQGTNSTQDFSRGNTLPIAAMPFGMAHWTLQSHANTPWMFHPDVRRIQGIRCTHQLSPWLDDYGQATFLPFCGDVRPEAAYRASSYRPEDARLTPYSLQLFLLRYRAHIELVPTERCAIVTATLDDGDKEKILGLAFDVLGKNSVVKPDQAKRQLLFTSTANAGGVPENFATYYVIQFPEVWESFEVNQLHEHQVGMVRFKAGKSIEARIATSFISFEQAQLNLEEELGGTRAATLRETGSARWNDHLNRIQIEGAGNDQQWTFYSYMYRALLFPRT